MVSVLMSVCNGERYVQEAVESILQQTFVDFEFIIINDASTDDTKEILCSFTDRRITLLENTTNIGLTRSLNKAIQLAKGKYIARQDADDISLPDRLEQEVRILDEKPRVIIVGTFTDVIDEKGVNIGEWKYPTSDSGIRWQMLFDNSFVHTSVMFRADVVTRNNLQYNEHIFWAQDYELWSRLLDYGKGLNIGKILVKHRVHSNQVSKTATEKQNSIADRISLSFLKGLGFNFTDSEVKKLRKLFIKFPQATELEKQDIILCKTMLKILSAFAEMENLDPDVVRSIRRQWIAWILGTVHKHRPKNLWMAGLIWSMLRTDPQFVLGRVSKRFTSLFREVSQIT